MAGGMWSIGPAFAKSGQNESKMDVNFGVVFSNRRSMVSEKRIRVVNMTVFSSIDPKAWSFYVESCCIFFTVVMRRFT
jgi:hypothetical protein